MSRLLSPRAAVRASHFARARGRRRDAHRHVDAHQLVDAAFGRFDPGGGYINQCAAERHRRGWNEHAEIVFATQFDGVFDVSRASTAAPGLPPKSTRPGSCS